MRVNVLDEAVEWEAAMCVLREVVHSKAADAFPPEILPQSAMSQGEQIGEPETVADG